MVFSSNVFLFFFLPAVLLAVWICPGRYRNPILLVSSLFFYAWGEPRYIWLMLATIAMNYFCGLAIAARQDKGGSARLPLVVSVCANLLLLGFFKYAGFIVGSLNALLPPSLRLAVPDIPLPIGISFYIFQSMSYTIDVYRRQVPAQRSLVRFGTYVSMFPQLIAGPIVRYSDVARQLDDTETRPGLPVLAQGVSLFIIGLAKKMLLANRMGALWTELSAAGGCLSGWVCLFAYSLQIYFDFSGYSDMAIGLGKLLGFEFLKNFDYPYISKSITEFWRRWHISLSTWFKEYLYIPLGGNRLGPRRQILNILIVWALTGLWHGASWSFVIWGLYYAVLLTAEKLFLLKGLSRLPGFLRAALVFVAVSLGWTMFSFDDAGTALRFIGRLARFCPEGAHSMNVVLAYLPLLLLSFAAATPLPARLYHALDGRRIQGPLTALFLLALLLLCTAALASQSYNPFIYFRF